MPHQVGKERQAPLEHADGDQRLAGVIGGDLGAQLGYAPAELLLGHDLHKRLLHPVPPSVTGVNARRNASIS